MPPGRYGCDRRITFILRGYSMSKSHRGPATVAPACSQRRRSSRSAVTTRRCPCRSRACAAMVSSPEPGARTSRTRGSRPRKSAGSSARRAAPSRTSTQYAFPGGWTPIPPAGGRPRAARTPISWHSRAAARARSFHQPSARAPITLAMSTMIVIDWLSATAGVEGSPSSLGERAGTAVTIFRSGSITEE
jgi:hypothetical protein